MEIIQVPDTCPKCYSKIVAVIDKPVLKILSNKSWRICESQECDFQESNTEFQTRMGFGSV